MLFIIFIRYSSFAFNQSNFESSDDLNNISLGRWPLALNAIFNATAHYIFIVSVVLMLLPIFLGKLSVVRDIYAAEIFTPLSRITFSIS